MPRKSSGGPTRGRAAVRHPGNVETTSVPAETGRAPARRRVPVRTRLDFWFDGALLAAYTLVYSLGFTGLAIHEWLGLGIGLALLLHLTLHWDWVVRTTRKLFARGGRDRAIWLLNLTLLVVMTLCVLSGVLISQVALYQLGISVHASPFWANVHDTTAKLTLILVSVHVAVRWRWIVSVGGRLLGNPRLGNVRQGRSR